jgi:hypothetical protein
MAQYFFSAVEYLKKQTFELLVPSHYHACVNSAGLYVKPAPLEKPNPWRSVSTNRLSAAPFNPLEDTERLQSARYSTETMIDMVQRKVEFQIVNQNDIPLIFDGVDRYLLSLENDVSMGCEIAVPYARKVIEFRDILYKFYYKYMMENPTAKETLYTNNNADTNLFSMLSTLNSGNTAFKNLDPLIAKRSPPYDIDKTVPQEEKVSAEPEGVDVAFGLAAVTQPLRKQDDFDFTAFLRGG